MDRIQRGPPYVRVILDGVQVVDDGPRGIVVSTNSTSITYPRADARRLLIALRLLLEEPK